MWNEWFVGCVGVIIVKCEVVGWCCVFCVKIEWWFEIGFWLGIY